MLRNVSGIYLKNTKPLVQSAVCTPMFIEEMTTVVKVWEESTYPMTDK